MASVVLEHVSKRYGAVTAVTDVNLEVQDQEFLVLLGPSGCGKTTTLRMIAGLEELSEGTIHIGKKDVGQLPPKDRDIAMVFQNYALYPHMTVFDNMAFGLKLRKVERTEIRRRVQGAAEILGIGALLSRRPKELSGGQRQRVALGRAIVREPQAFLMDEPLSNLDAKLRTQTRVELKRLHQRLGATVIYVTHDQTEAMTLGTRIVVMRDGVVQQADTPDNIYHHPANKFVATFVGTPPMNLLDGSLESVGGSLMVHCEDQQVILPANLAKPLESLKDRRVTLGIRPENIEVVANREVPQGYVNLRAVVRVIEPLGHEKMVYCDVGSKPIVVRTPNDWVGEVGGDIIIALDTSHLRLFDPDTEAAVG